MSNQATIIAYTDENTTGSLAFAFTDENMAEVERDARELLDTLTAKQRNLTAQLTRYGRVEDHREAETVGRAAERLYELLDLVSKGGRYVADWAWTPAAKWNYIDQIIEDAEAVAA
jgi:hypothetical protein